MSVCICVWGGGGGVKGRQHFPIAISSLAISCIVFTKSVNSNFRVLIGSRNSEYPWLFTHGFATGAKVATIHTNTKKARNFGLSVFTGS